MKRQTKTHNEAKNCTVTFDLGFTTNGMPPEPITVKKGESAGSNFPKNPSRPTWDFTGWKDSSDAKYNGNTIINDDVTLKAFWNFIPGPMNPFITDRFTADPAAFIDDDDTAYIVCGEDALPPNAPSNEYFRIPRWLIYSTKDMKTFKYEAKILESDDFTYGQKNTAWASQAIKGRDGKYYFYGTVLYNGGGYEMVIAVAVADKPTGPWKQATTAPLVRNNMVVNDTGYAGNDNIDPTVFIDDDGSAWLCWGQRKPRIAKLKENMIEIERPIKLLFPDTWTSQDRCEEGPFLYKRNGMYYMVYASMKMNGANPIAETISYAMAPSLEGPWTDGVRITDCAPGVNGQGNSYTVQPAVFDFQGQTYLFYHNASLKLTMEDGSIWEGNTGRRSLCVDYLYFNADGTIQFVDVRNFNGISVPPVDR